MGNFIEPHELNEDVPYQDALAEYSKQIAAAARAEDAPWGRRAGIFLYMGRFEEALADFVRVNELSKQCKFTGGDPSCVEHICVCLWLLGRCEEAVRTLSERVAGRIGYGDLAGAVSPGLMLWYLGVTYRDERAQAHRYLQRKLKAERIKYWPGPIAQYVEGAISFDEALARSRWSPYGFGECLSLAKKNMLARRELCQAFFYKGVKVRSEGDEKGCIATMMECLRLGPAPMEQEWLLAQAESKGKVHSAKVHD
jgi:tetratricopeptide (TPR) repeat protein